VIIPLDITQLFCPGFTLAAGPPSGFTTDIVGCWGGALWRACNLTAFTPCLTGPVDYLLAYCHEGPAGSIPRGYLCETGIPLLALSHYTFSFFLLAVIMHPLDPFPSPRLDTLAIPSQHPFTGHRLNHSVPLPCIHTFSTATRPLYPYSTFLRRLFTLISSIRPL
jgi:hypothetical protein